MSQTTGARPLDSDVDWSGTESWDDADDEDSSDASGERQPGRRGRKTSKPKIRMNLFNLRVNDQPVSFSGSMKGLKGVQIKATFKL